MQTREPRGSMWSIYRFAFDFREFLREIEIRGSAAGDQPRTAIERQILYRPLNENENATLERNQISYMDKSPNQPRQEPRNVKTENVCHRGRPSNHCQRPFVEVTKRWKLPVTLYFSQDRLCYIGSSLHGDLGAPPTGASASPACGRTRSSKPPAGMAPGRPFCGSARASSASPAAATPSAP